MKNFFKNLIKKLLECSFRLFSKEALITFTKLMFLAVYLAVPPVFVVYLDAIVALHELKIDAEFSAENEDEDEDFEGDETQKKEEKNLTRNYIFLFGLATYVIVRVLVSIIGG